jgi:hypothetical protein
MWYTKGSARLARHMGGEEAHHGRGHRDAAAYLVQRLLGKGGHHQADDADDGGHLLHAERRRQSSLLPRRGMQQCAARKEPRVSLQLQQLPHEG